ncbi:MAG TPA: hypothetical protein VFS43_42835 [Polyangiaceae bacterium]|nr:hypothetical protein [Polyangiaceae bacterium]
MSRSISEGSLSFGAGGKASRDGDRPAPRAARGGGAAGRGWPRGRCSLQVAVIFTGGGNISIAQRPTTAPTDGSNPLRM